MRERSDAREERDRGGQAKPAAMHGAAERALPERVLRLQRTVGNRAVNRLLADADDAPNGPHDGITEAPAPGASGPAPDRWLQRDDRTAPYSVVAPMLASDRDRKWFDPTDKTTKPVWTEEAGYVKNPSAKPMNAILKNGKVAGGFENGVFAYVVDNDGQIIIGKRLGEPGNAPGRATGMPHPTLIGGKNPTVQAAGEVEIKAGRIARIDNQSGHYQPSRSAMKTAIKSYMELPTSAFHPEFRAESVHYEGELRTTKAFKSFDMLKLKVRDFKRALRGLKPRALLGKMRSKRFKAAAKDVGETLITIVVILALDYLFGKVSDHFLQKYVEKQIDNLGPDIEEDLLSHRDQAEALLEEDAEGAFYMNVRLKIETATYQDYTGPQGELEDHDVMPAVKLVTTGFSRQPWDPTPVQKSDMMCGASGYTFQTTWATSVEIRPADFFADETAATESVPAGAH
jgi:hypothetical protein